MTGASAAVGNLCRLFWSKKFLSSSSSANNMVGSGFEAWKAALRVSEFYIIGQAKVIEIGQKRNFLRLSSFRENLRSAKSQKGHCP